MAADCQPIFVRRPLLAPNRLGSRIAGRSALPWRKAAEIGITIADGLASAHSKGIIHRTHSVRAIGGADTHAEGLILGTAGYISPEPVRGTPC